VTDNGPERLAAATVEARECLDVRINNAGGQIRRSAVEEFTGGKRQDSERKRAVARVGLRWLLPAVAYAACSTAHTSSHRSWNRRR